MWSLVVSSMLLVTLISNLSEGNIKNVTDDDVESAVKSEKDRTILANDMVEKLCTAKILKTEHCKKLAENSECKTLPNECLECKCALDCQYGNQTEANCVVPKEVTKCVGARKFKRQFTCAFCYQSDSSHHVCEENVSCDSVADPNKRNYIANCTVDSQLICLGRRTFHKQKPCNWTGGHRWLTALILSITLGGFGADR